MDSKQAFYVESTDSRKFKMVIRGDLGKLTVAKIRRYLKSYGVPDGQALTFNGMVLSDDMTGEQFGLVCESTLQLRDAAVLGRDAYGSSSDPFAAPSRRGPAAASFQAPAEHSSSRQPHQHMHAPHTSHSHGVDGVDPLANAKENIDYLSEQLGVALSFDSNLTAVLGTDNNFTVLMTYDPPTERLYLYSSILTSLPPKGSALREKLFEILLEGSLLGREVCGGGIGVSQQNGLVALTTSLLMRHSSAYALSATMPSFVEALVRWRSLVEELME